MKATMIVGEPAVGKSYIMKKFMKQMGNWVFENPKYIPQHVHMKNGTMAVVLGNYTDKTHEFPGTDRMSMACQPHVIRFLRQRMDQDVAVFFEGDRLGNASMIRALQTMSNIDLQVVHIITNLDRKRDNQSNAFRTSRKTKIRNLTANNPVQRFVNDTPDDAAFIVDYLMEYRL